MSLLAALACSMATGSLTEAATAADFFPLVPGVKRVYEQKAQDDKVTMVEEVDPKPAFFDDKPAMAIVQRSQFNQVISTQYYRVNGPTVYLVGTAEERSSDAKGQAGTVDFSKPRVRRMVLMTLLPAMPVFRYEGKETPWSYGEVQFLRGAGDDQPIKTDETAIKGLTRPLGTRTVLGQKVEAIEVRAEVQLGTGNLAQRIVETTVYARGIGMVESIRKTSGGGQKAGETRTRLVALEGAKAGG